MRIGIVNDMPLAVEALRRAVMQKPEHRVVWIARDGIEAVELCAKETPDLVLMDLLMPRMDGVEATARIMAATPCPIVVVTVNVGNNARLVFEAMGNGALDAVDTPQLGAPGDGNALPLLAKIDTIRRLIGDTSSAQAQAQAPAAGPSGFRPVPKGNCLVAIGASAGGPAALALLLAALPATFPAAVVVVQHVDEQFSAGMAAWLDRESPLPVRLAREGDRPQPGTVLLAATNDHLTFKSPACIGYTPIPIEYVYRPSVDVFFLGVHRYWSGEAIGVILTGMGRDGALGLKALRDKGCRTIAQDRASSAVYGMPKAAVTLGAAIEVLALEQIAPRLVQLTKGDGTSHSSPTHTAAQGGIH